MSLVRNVVARCATPAFAPMVSLYITKHRDRLASIANPLTSSEKGAMGPFFPARDLDRVRIIIADPLPVTEPPFSGFLKNFGFDYPSLALTAAITFDHVIACREPMTPSLLFHELIHVVQYRLLGIKSFAKEYVNGFLHTASYHEIPLEQCAFHLEYRFNTSDLPWNAEAEVAKWLNPPQR